MALSPSRKHVLWLGRLICELSENEPNPKLTMPQTTMFTDNTSGISLIKDSHIFEGKKHIEIKSPNINELLENKTVSLVHVKSGMQPAGICPDVVPKNVWEIYFFCGTCKLELGL